MLKRAYDRLCGAEAIIAGVFLIMMVVLIFLGGVMRMIGTPINWSTDAATCLFAWACFLSADIAWRKNSLMAIDVVTTRLSERVQFYLRMFNYAIIAAFLLYLIILGFQLSWISRIRSFQGIPQVSYSWVTASLPFGALLLLLTTILKVMAELRGEKQESHAVDVL
jgi:TRAP-type C4-dicarboxylate transport system permease small subunit